MAEEYDAAEALLKNMRPEDRAWLEREELLQTPPKKRFRLGDDEGLVSVPVDPYGHKKRVSVAEWLKEHDADFEAVVAKGKRYGLTREAVKNLPKWIMKKELHQAEQNRLHGQMEQPLEGGFFDLAPYLSDEQAKVQGLTPLQAFALNKAAFTTNMNMPIASVGGLAKTQKFATKYGRKLYEMPQLDAIDSNILAVVARQNLGRQNIPEALALQRLLKGSVPNVPLGKKPFAKYKDPNVVTKAFRPTTEVRSGWIPQAEIEGHKLPWLDAHHQWTPRAAFKRPIFLEPGDEADALRQIRAALAREGLPKDLVVEPTKGMFKDTGQKMYMMPRVKSDLTGPWPGEHRKLADTDFSKISKQDRISLVNQLENAIDSMHRQGVGHGDLHSGNILVSYKKNKPTLEIIDPWPSKDPAFSIGADRKYLTDHKMRILYPEIHARPGFFLGKQSDMYMKKYGVGPIAVEDYKRLYQQKMHNREKVSIEELGKQRIKDLAEGN